MKNITCELRAFLEATGLRQRHLSKMSGVSTATINRLVNGSQCDVRLSTAEALRSAMALVDEIVETKELKLRRKA